MQKFIKVILANDALRNRSKKFVILPLHYPGPMAQSVSDQWPIIIYQLNVQCFVSYFLAIGQAKKYVCLLFTDPEFSCWVGN